MNNKLIIYSDGGARGNPGPAALGVVIYEKSKRSLKKIFEQSSYLGIKTNNQAEYLALIAGLTKAKELKANDVECNLDSELLVNQMNLKYKVKNKDLAPLFVKAWNLSKSFKKCTFHYIPREKNKEADKLVNKTLDKMI